MFPEGLTSARLYTFWCGVREEAGLPGLRIHDARHAWASQGIMNGVGLTTVGRLLGHRKRATTAIYTHLDDVALRDAAAQAAAAIARAMGFTAEPPPLPDEADRARGGRVVDWLDGGSTVSIRRGPSAEAGVAAGVKTLTGVECGLPSTVFTVTPDTGAEGAASGDDQGAL